MPAVPQTTLYADKTRVSGSEGMLGNMLSLSSRDSINTLVMIHSLIS